MNDGAGALVMFQVPSPLANAIGMVDHPGVCRTRAMSVRPLPLKSPGTSRTPGVLDHESPPMNDGAGALVMFQVPSPLANAIGMVDHPGVCRTRAMSVRPLPLKSPGTSRTPGVLDHESPPMNDGAGALVMFQVPSPLANAIGMVDHPGVCRTRAMSVRPLPLKSPGTSRTPGVLDHESPPMNDGAGALVMFQVPSPLANAIGMVDHPGVCRTRAMSVRPLPLKSPGTSRTPGALDHESPPMNDGAGALVMFQVPSPLANAIGMVDHPGVCRTRAMSVRPLPLKSPGTSRTPGALDHESPPMNDGAGALV